MLVNVCAFPGDQGEDLAFSFLFCLSARNDTPRSPCPFAEFLWEWSRRVPGRRT